MSYKGDNHAGNKHTADDVKAMQAAYAENRLAGMGVTAAAKNAGYFPCQDVETRNRAAILAELDKRGMDESWLADQYQYVLERIKTDDTGNFDGQAYNKALLQISYLRGHGKSSVPQVAIQQNFTGGGGGSGATGSPESDERKRVEELLARVEDLIRRTEEKVGSLGLTEVHEGEVVPDDSGPRSRMGEAAGDEDIFAR